MALTGQIFPSKLQIGLYHLQGVGKGKKKLTPLALEGFEKIDFNFLKKIIYKWKNNFYVFGNLIVPSDRKSREDHESPHFCGSTTLSFWVMAILRYLFFNFFEFSKKNFSNFLAIFFSKCLFLAKESNEQKILNENWLILKLWINWKL